MYGIYLGVALIIVDLLFYVLELYISNWKGYITYVVILGGVVISAISYRDKQLNGYINYGQSFKVGFFTSIIAAFAFLLYFAILMYFAGEEIQTALLRNTEEQMLEKVPDMTDEQLEMTMEITKWVTTPIWQTIFSFLGIIFFGVIFSLIASIFIKKENKSLEVEQQ
jgi:ABC-type phosphate/phosphonate transport system permease subunit